MGREQEDEALLDVVDDAPALGQAVDQGREGVVAEDEVRRLPGDRRAAAHRHGDVRPMEGRASFTPSPVTATIRPSVRAAPTIRSF